MKHLLPEVPQYYKTNLHTHTNVSDGDYSPEAVKQFYKDRGYSAVAFSDHEVCIAHPELNDPDFLALTAYELSTSDTRDLSVKASYRRTYHLNLLSKQADNRWQFYDPARVWGNARHYVDRIVTDGVEHWTYSVEDMNRIIARANEHGFLVTYNHPVWSQQDYRDYARLEGLWATEVFNTECCRQGYNDDQDKILQDLICLGNKVFPVAADDFHHLEDENCIAQGWVMVGAAELSYDALIRALERGDFYASTGPSIESLTIDGTMLSVNCSAARSIDIIANCRYCRRTAYPGITEASFDLAQWMNIVKDSADENACIRVVVTDVAGKKAYTRPYHVHELKDE